MSFLIFKELCSLPPFRSAGRIRTRLVLPHRGGRHAVTTDGRSGMIALKSFSIRFAGAKRVKQIIWWICSLCGVNGTLSISDCMESLCLYSPFYIQLYSFPWFRRRCPSGQASRSLNRGAFSCRDGGSVARAHAHRVAHMRSLLDAAHVHAHRVDIA
jgi:hypothetical protein